MMKASRPFAALAAVTAAVGLTFAGAPPALAQGAAPIKIGLLPPLTGPLASPGAEMVNGFNMFWDSVGKKAGNRAIEIVVADSGCKPDQALAQARRLVLQEKVDILVGPLCGHEGPAVAQVSRETGIPLIMDPAGADSVTKWDRLPTVLRTAVSASQLGHPMGDYLYKDLGLRNVTFIASDYTWGHEVALGAVKTYTALGGKVNRILWNPLGTKDYGTTINSIPADSDGVVAVIAGADRIRLFEDWFSFGADKKHKLYGGYWLHEDMLPQIDERAVGLMSNSVHYVAGIDTPENKAFVDEYVRRYKRMPSWFAESAYTAGLWLKTALDAVGGDVANKEAFLKAVQTAEIKAPRGPLKLDSYGNPIQNVYITKVEQTNHPVLGKILVNKPVKTYPAVSQFWTWKPEEFLAAGPYKR